MNTSQTEHQPQHIGQEKLLAFVRTVIGASRGREDDEHPLPPGPWGPVVRAALERIGVFGPRPEPWKIALAHIFARHPELFDLIGQGHGFIDKVALNPQPLPPRFAFLAAVAQAVIGRAELLQEVADAKSQQGEQQGNTVVGGYIRRFGDDFCLTGFRLRWPFPGPRPHWFASELDGFDLVVIATQFEQASKEAFGADLRHNLAGASARFVEAGLSRMR
jgi:hypothetical protein